MLYVNFIHFKDHCGTLKVCLDEFLYFLLDFRNKSYFVENLKHMCVSDQDHLSMRWINIVLLCVSVCDFPPFNTTGYQAQMWEVNETYHNTHLHLHRIGTSGCLCANVCLHLSCKDVCK